MFLLRYLLDTILDKRIKTLNSTMFLLRLADTVIRIFDMCSKFHYVSIKIEKTYEKEGGEIALNSTMFLLRCSWKSIQRMIISALNSTMFLLRSGPDIAKDRYSLSLNSTMFLLR